VPKQTVKDIFKKIGIWPSTGAQALGRGIALAAVVGIVAGLGAITFHGLCQAVGHFSVDWIAGYHEPSPVGEPELFSPTTTGFHPWILVAVVTLGGLVCGWLVYTFAPETQGHGTDAAIEAYHHKRGVIRGRVPLVKMLASAITIGTGGSGGQEGPISQIGAGFGSFLATRFKLSDAERRSMMAAGVGAGIGAIFHAPLAGAIFATEVLYRDPDFESENLIPAFISTTMAYCVFCLVYGFEPLFSVQPMHFDNPLLLLLFAGLAVAMSLASLCWVKCFYGVHHLFAKLNVPNMIKPAIGGFLASLLAVAGYYTLSTLGPTAQFDSLSMLSVGYGFLQKMVVDPNGSNLAIAVLLVVGIGKILTTSLTISSGGSAGVFAPIMVIGGALGGVIGLLCQRWFPGMSIRIDVFVILGMAGFFASTANTPLSALIMVSEMTASYTLLLPSMWVCALSYMLSHGWTIFSEQVPARVDSPAHRGDFIVDVLQGMTVRDAIPRAPKQMTTIPMDMSLNDIVHMITDTRQICFPVIDAQGNYFGLFGLNDVRQFLYDSSIGDLAVAHDLATRDDDPLTLQTELSEAMGQFAFRRFEELPVVDADNPQTVISLLRRQDVIATYTQRLLAMRQLQ